MPHLRVEVAALCYEVITPFVITLCLMIAGKSWRCSCLPASFHLVFSLLETKMCEVYVQRLYYFSPSLTHPGCILKNGSV